MDSKRHRQSTHCNTDAVDDNVKKKHKIDETILTDPEENTNNDSNLTPYQLPIFSRTNLTRLPNGYYYHTECHLNWYRVATVKLDSNEIVDILESVHDSLIPPSFSLCRDGQCPRKECSESNFSLLENKLKTKMKDDISEETKRSKSYYMFGKKAIITDDNYGYFINVDEDKKISNPLCDPKQIYRRKFVVSKACPLL